jgi:hypothetical protein
MELENMNRGYLLPPGCKDLIDALTLNSMQQSPFNKGHLAKLVALKAKLSPQEFTDFYQEALKHFKPHFIKCKPQLPNASKPVEPPPFVAEIVTWTSSKGFSAELPPITGEIVIRSETSVAKLAALLALKPFQVVADVLELGIFVSAEDSLGFEIISKVARKHGFFAIRAAS